MHSAPQVDLPSIRKTVKPRPLEPIMRLLSEVIGGTFRKRKPARQRRRRRPRRRRAAGRDEPEEAEVDEEAGSAQSDSSQSDGGVSDNASELDDLLDEWQEAHDDMPMAMQYNYDTFAMHINGIDGPVAGKVKPITGRDSTSVYCRFRQCAMQGASAKLPSQDSMKSWFAKGAAIPNNKAGREKRVAMFKDMCRSAYFFS